MRTSRSGVPGFRGSPLAPSMWSGRPEQSRLDIAQLEARKPPVPGREDYLNGLV
jgi:hypothetical protein